MSETYPKSAFAKRFLQNILPSSVDSTAKLLHFFELRKNNTKKNRHLCPKHKWRRFDRLICNTILSVHFCYFFFPAFHNW